MPTNPKNISATLHLIRAGLVSGLLTKEEVIDWAYNIITKDDQPDIFFIDLALLSSKSINDVIYYISDHLNFESASVQGRPLLRLLYQRYKTGQFNLEQTIRKLYALKSEAIFTDAEEAFIYGIESDFDLAQENIYGSLAAVQQETERFLQIYEDYSVDKFERWQELDNQVDQLLDNKHKKQTQQYHRLQPAESIKLIRPWWKFW